MDKRIGRITENGVEYPEVSISGKPYDRTQDKLGIGDDQFIILDRWLSDDERVRLIAEIKASLKPTRKPKGINNDTE